MGKLCQVNERPMNSEQDRLINLAVHESSDPEMLRRDAESKTGSSPHPESSNPDLESTGSANSEGSKPELLRHNSDSGIASQREDFSHEYEEGRENVPQSDFDLPRDDKLAEDQIMIANRHAG